MKITPSIPCRISCNADCLSHHRPAEVHYGGVYKNNDDPGRSREVKEFNRPDDPVRDWIGSQMPWNARGKEILLKKGYSKPKRKRTVQRFTEAQIQDIITRKNNGEKVLNLAKEYGCHVTTIRSVIRESDI